MKSFFNLCLVFMGLALVSAQTQAQSPKPLRVFACEPEWKALVEEVGGERVDAFSATTAFQDPHYIEARPSLIAKVRKADLVICTGASLESAWLDVLLRQAGNSKVVQGTPGLLLLSDFVERLEIPEKLDRSMGDIHAEGNPHVHLGPYRLLKISKVLSERLEEVDPNSKEFYQTRQSEFASKWREAIAKWEAQAKELKGKKAVVYHKNWTYLLVWLGIEKIGDIEPKPGVPPTTKHLVSLLATLDNEKADWILMTPFHNQKGANWLSERSNIPVVVLPFTVGGNEESKDLFSLYQTTIDLLMQNLDG